MAVLLLLVALIAPSIAQCNNYYTSCPTPSPSDQCDYNNDLFATSYINVVSNRGKSSNLDNVCHTFFPMNDKHCTYLAHLTGVYTDGSVETLNFIVTSNSTNVFYYYSPTCAFEQTLLTNDNDVEIIARRIISGECKDILYPVFVSYPCLQYGSNLDLAQIKQVLSRYGYGCVDLLVLPRNLSTQCVNTQNSTNTGGISNCPGQCPDSDDDSVSVASYPNYSYNPPNCPSYSYNPPTSGCGCS